MDATVTQASCVGVDPSLALQVQEDGSYEVAWGPWGLVVQQQLLDLETYMCACSRLKWRRLVVSAGLIRGMRLRQLLRRPPCSVRRRLVCSRSCGC